MRCDVIKLEGTNVQINFYCESHIHTDRRTGTKVYSAFINNKMIKMEKENRNSRMGTEKQRVCCVERMKEMEKGRRKQVCFGDTFIEGKSGFYCLRHTQITHTDCKWDNVKNK